MPNPMQPRRTFDIDELQSLSNSIKTYGLIQPIAVKRIESLPFPMPKSTAKYEIIAGERRWRASKMAGLNAEVSKTDKGTNTNQIPTLNRKTLYVPNIK